MAASTQHKSFPQPPDPSISVWRYMDLAKLMWLLQRRALYFSRLDKLGDPFEGHYTKALAIGRAEYIERMNAFNRGIDPAPYGEIFDRMLQSVREAKSLSGEFLNHVNQM